MRRGGMEEEEDQRRHEIIGSPSLMSHMVDTNVGKREDAFSVCYASKTSRRKETLFEANERHERYSHGRELN